MKILAIDLGKSNSVACLFDTATHQSGFEPIAPRCGGASRQADRRQSLGIRAITCQNSTGARGHRNQFDEWLGAAVGWMTCAKGSITRCWLPTPIRRHGVGRTSNRRPTGMMPSNSLNLLPLSKSHLLTFQQNNVNTVI